MGEPKMLCRTLMDDIVTSFMNDPSSKLLY
jgi:hypothetical protein